MSARAQRHRPALSTTSSQQRQTKGTSSLNNEPPVTPTRPGVASTSSPLASTPTTSTDPRRSSVASSIRKSANQVRPSSNPEVDVYVSTFKRPRTSISTAKTAVSPRDISTGSAVSPSQEPTRHAACGFCQWNNQSHLCDGGVNCSRCRSAGDRPCTYRLCQHGKRCQTEGCTFLHSDQWNRVAEGAKRKVFERNGREVSGRGL